VSFALLTGIYERTQAEFFEATASSVLAQTHKDFEWIVLAHGPIPSSLSALVRNVARDSRVRHIQIDQNLGIIGGLHKCLNAAAAEYAVPLDGDDLLAADALECFAHEIVKRGRPEFLYSDEDHLTDSLVHSPYRRPDWDPILNLASSYIWHLCAFQRRKAIELGVFTDPESNWCHDWDTVSRFSRAGVSPVHVPEILYHWRCHTNSSTNQPTPEKGSLASQGHVLQTWISRQRHPERYTIEPFPIFRGAPEWWIKRRREYPKPIQVILIAQPAESAVQSIFDLIRECHYPALSIDILGVNSIPVDDRQLILKQLHEICVSFPELQECHSQLRCWPELGLNGFTRIREHLQSSLTLVYSSRVKPRGSEWPWEVLCLKEFHPSIVLFSGRILDQANIVLAGRERLDRKRLAVSPDYGRAANDPGSFALGLKPQSVQAVDSRFFVADGSFLRTVLDSLPEAAKLQQLGAWLGAEALKNHYRVAYSPLLSATAHSSYSGNKYPEREEVVAFTERYELLPEFHRLDHDRFFERLGTSVHRTGTGKERLREI